MNLERFILNTLSAVPTGRMLSAAAIAGLLPAGIDATPDDVNLSLTSLQARRQVVGITTDDGVLWQITPSGLARIA